MHRYCMVEIMQKYSSVKGFQGLVFFLILRPKIKQKKIHTKKEPHQKLKQSNPKQAKPYNSNIYIQ